MRDKREIASDVIDFVCRHAFTVAFCGVSVLAISSYTHGHVDTATTLALTASSIVLMKHALLDKYSNARLYIGAAGGLAAAGAIMNACDLSGVPAAAVVVAATALGAAIGSDAIFEDRSARGIYSTITYPVRQYIVERRQRKALAEKDKAREIASFSARHEQVRYR